MGVRWTVGDVNRRGFDALRLSIRGASSLFGPTARYRVYVNSVEVPSARARTGEVPDEVEWTAASRGDLPHWLSERIDAGLAEGVAWKFAPLQAFPDRYELALDNDVVLWDLPRALHDWLGAGTGCVLAEDVRRHLGVFDPVCPPGAMNSGIRGLPPGFDLARALRCALDARPVRLEREGDEQGLQTAALAAAGTLRLVAVEDVTICSPFPPHVRHLGRAGAHFVGLNTRHLGFAIDGRPGEDIRADHWDAQAAALEALIDRGKLDRGRASWINSMVSGGGAALWSAHARGAGCRER